MKSDVEHQPLLSRTKSTKQRAAAEGFCRRILSGVVLVLMIFLWVGMSEVAAAMQKGCGTGKAKPFHHPFFMCYVIHGGYTIFFFVWLVWEAIERMCAKPTEEKFLSSSEKAEHKAARRHAQKHILFHSTWMGLLSFVVGYSFYLSLPLISVGANTAIYNSSSAFVYVFSLLLRMEHLSVVKIVALLFSVAGVVLVQLLSKPEPTSMCPSEPTMAPAANHSVSQQTMGYIFVIVSTMLYALYEVLYKRVLSPSLLVQKFEAKTLPRADIQQAEPALAPLPPSGTRQIKFAALTLGLFGIAQIVLIWPGFFIVDAIGVEPFGWPPSDAFHSLLATTAMDSVFNVLLLVGIALTSPLFISVGCLMTVPLSILADYVIHDTLMAPGALVGVAGICIGFLLISWAEYREFKQRQVELGLVATK